MTDLEEPVKLPLPLETLANVAEQPEKLASSDKVAREAALNATKFVFDLG